MHSPLDTIFDIVIVGAGPAGCVLANRLTEDEDKRVLLVEAGPDAVVPGREAPDLLDPFCGMASDNPAFRWSGLMAEAGADPGNGPPRASYAFTQGFGVGGGSNINGMGVERGQPDDFDEWRDLGAEGWGWEDVLPYFRKLEHDLDFPESSLHGDSGPMPVRRLARRRWAPFAASVGDALEARGYPFIADYTGDLRDGFSAATTNCLPERRMSASMAYLTDDVRCRPNLTILSSAQVERIVVEGRCAKGVVVTFGGKGRHVAAREVILSAGALQSPALLMRSGIGGAGQLRKLDIQVIADLAGVGANLQNHPCVMLTTYLSAKAKQPADNPWFLQNWFRYSSGHVGGVPADMHVLILNKGSWHRLGHRIGILTASVFKPFSRGSVTLSAANPADHPVIRFNTLQDPRDEERMVGGVRLLLELLSEPAVARWHHQLFLANPAIVAGLAPRTSWNAVKAGFISSILDFALFRRLLLWPYAVDMDRLLRDDAALLAFVRRQVGVQLHVCGTCRMGRSDDPAAVVDNAGRVHGVGGLRVVDASVFPSIPRSNLQFPVLMVAEKIADQIRRDGAGAR